MTQTDYAERVRSLRAFGATPPAVAERLERELSAYEQVAERALAHWHTRLPQRDWTPAQESEHVILVNEGTVKVAALLLSDKPLRPVPQEPVVTDAQGRRQAPPGTVPTSGQPWEALAERFQASGAALRSAALRAPEEAERRFWHPAMGELTALDWLRMAAYHVRHHRKLLETGLDRLEGSA
ncbi:DinB family protein [Deinococcus irradiatisoli]|uniref:DinB family protein n=1 Tax=Deinococcus irradiatisoli TaxID=2202254 RepID=A0A2Z3JGT3_9DEIO|nr:DinB family protein [Deinococcus irradiatisoli]AWN22560.1 DinB family protein [Deinococcus irradiatisoli]